MAITKVEHLINGQVVFTQSAAPFSPLTSNTLASTIGVGNHTISARVYEDGVLTYTTPTRNITITEGGASFDADYQAVLDYATANSIPLPDATQQAADNQLLIDYKATGGWAKDDCFAQFKGSADPAFKLIDWKRLVQMQAVGTLNWGANGVTGDGDGTVGNEHGYIDTLFNPSTAANFALANSGVNFVRSSASDGNAAFGLNNVNRANQWVGLYNGDSYINVNGAESGKILGGITEYTGYNGVYRENNTDITVYSNGSSSKAFAVDSARINGNMYLLARNNIGAAASFHSKSGLSFWTAGASKLAEHNAIKTVLE